MDGIGAQNARSDGGGCGPTRGFGNTAKALSFGSIAQSSREGRSVLHRDSATNKRRDYRTARLPNGATTERRDYLGEDVIRELQPAQRQVRVDLIQLATQRLERFA